MKSTQRNSKRLYMKPFNLTVAHHILVFSCSDPFMVITLTGYSEAISHKTLTNQSLDTQKKLKVESQTTL